MYYHLVDPVESIADWTLSDLAEWLNDYLLVLFGDKGFEAMTDQNFEGPMPCFETNSVDAYAEPVCYVVRGPGDKHRLQIGIETIHDDHLALFSADFIGSAEVAWQAAHAVSDALRELYEAQALPWIVGAARQMFGAENLAATMVQLPDRLEIIRFGLELKVDGESTLKNYLSRPFPPGPDNDYDWGDWLDDLKQICNRYQVDSFIVD